MIPQLVDYGKMYQRKEIPIPIKKIKIKQVNNTKFYFNLISIIIILIGISLLYTRNKYKEEKLLNLCIKKSYRLLRWQPVLSIDELVKFTVSWYQNWAKKIYCNKITEKQILNYYNLAIKRKKFWIK